MSVEAILTVVTVALAVMALIPQERAHDLQVRLGTVTRTVVLISSLLVLYWALLEQVHALPIIRGLPRPVQWYGKWRPDNMSLVVLLAAAGTVYWNYRRSLPVFRLPRLTAAIGDAIARRRYGECIHLLETHRRTIRRAYSGRYWQVYLRERFAPTPFEALRRTSAVKSAKSLPAGLRRTWHRLASRLRRRRHAVAAPEQVYSFPEPGKFVKSYTVWAETPRHSAHDLIRLTSLTPALVTEIANVHPYLGLELLRIESTWIYREFAEGFARALHEDPHSAFYRELRRAENIDANGIILLDREEQPLLWHLCEDGARPDGPRLLYTFIYSAMEPVWRQSDLSVRRTLNGPIGDFHERGRWTTAPFAAIYLIQIVAPRLAINPVAPLLNLYVARQLVSALLSQLRPADGVDLDHEWPTPTHYLLYETVSTLRDLVRILKDRPETLQAVRNDKTVPRDPETLSHHAIDVLGAVMYECMRSDKLDGRFKGYLLQVWWRAYAEKYEGHWSESERVLEAFARGGHTGGDMRHRDGVAEAMTHVDFPYRYSDAGDALCARFEISTV